jgi:ammonia channel protein AmtB
MAGRDLSVRGLATVDVRDFAGDLGVHSDSSAAALDGQ